MRSPSLLLAALTFLAACASSPQPADVQPSSSEELTTTTEIKGDSTSHTTTTHTPSPPAEAAKHVEGCKDGKPSECHAAGLDAYYQKSDPQTDKVAFDNFKKACDAGYAPSCSGLGILYASGRGVTKDNARAAQFFYDACIAGASAGCRQLADALRHGAGVAKDEAAADRANERQECVFQVELEKAELASCPTIAKPTPK